MAIRVTTSAGATVSPAGNTTSGRCRPARPMLVALAAVGAIGLLAGCGGESSPGGADATDGRPAAAATTNPGSDGATPGDSSSDAPYTDAEACAWLKENLPKVPDTPVGAQAQLAIGLSSFFEDHGGLPGADGYALDDAFSRGCPDLRAAALKKAGIKSFGNL
jgi:hypothetical protein